jgi:hypothetical protein
MEGRNKMMEHRTVGHIRGWKKRWTEADEETKSRRTDERKGKKEGSMEGSKNGRKEKGNLKDGGIVLGAEPSILDPIAQHPIT